MTGLILFQGRRLTLLQDWQMTDQEGSLQLVGLVDLRGYQLTTRLTTVATPGTSSLTMAGTADSDPNQMDQ